MNPAAASAASSAVAPAAKPDAAARLVSLHACRGFTMFCLMAGKASVLAIGALLGVQVGKYQLTHSEWEGVRYCGLDAGYYGAFRSTWFSRITEPGTLICGGRSNEFPLN